MAERYKRLEVEQRLGISRTKYYKWLKHLGIQPKRSGNGTKETFLDAEQFAQMQQLADYLNEGGALEDFNPHAIARPEPEELHENGNGNGHAKARARQFAQLVRSAAELKAGTEIARHTLAQQMKVEDLPEDLRELVEEAQQNTVPKPTGAQAIAAEYLSWGSSSE